jgi:hypothetical protein
MNIRNNFLTYEDAYNDLTSLLIEIETLDTPARLLISPSEIEEFKEGDHHLAAENNIADAEEKQDEPALRNVDINVARPAVASQYDFLPLQGLDPEIIHDMYVQLLASAKAKLEETLNYFYSDEFQISNDSIDESITLISRTCAHLGLLANGKYAGEVIYRNLHFDPEKNIISTILMDNNASVNTFVRREALGKEQKYTTLITALMLNPDKDLIIALLENGALDDEDNNALKLALVYSKPEILALLVQAYPQGLETVRAALDKSVEDSATYPLLTLNSPDGIVSEDAKKAKANLLSTLARLEKEGHEFDYSKQDKLDYLANLKTQIAAAATLAECLKIYDDNIKSPIINYKRNTLSLLSTSYPTTKVALIRDVQDRIYTLALALSYNNPDLATEIAKQALAHDAFSPRHISSSLFDGVNDQKTKQLTQLKGNGAIAGLEAEPQDHLGQQADNEQEEQKEHPAPIQNQSAAASSSSESRFNKFYSVFNRSKVAADRREPEMQEMVSMGASAQKPNKQAEEPASPRPQ